MINISLFMINFLIVIIFFALVFLIFTLDLSPHKSYATYMPSLECYELD